MRNPALSRDESNHCSKMHEVSAHHFVAVYLFRSQEFLQGLHHHAEVVSRPSAVPAMKLSVHDISNCKNNCALKDKHRQWSLEKLNKHSPTNWSFTSAPTNCVPSEANRTNVRSKTSGVFCSFLKVQNSFVALFVSREGLSGPKFQQRFWWDFVVSHFPQQKPPSIASARWLFVANSLPAKSWNLGQTPGVFTFALPYRLRAGYKSTRYQHCSRFWDINCRELFLVVNWKRWYHACWTQIDLQFGSLRWGCWAGCCHGHRPIVSSIIGIARDSICGVHSFLLDAQHSGLSAASGVVNSQNKCAQFFILRCCQVQVSFFVSPASLCQGFVSKGLGLYPVIAHRGTCRIVEESRMFPFCFLHTKIPKPDWGKFWACSANSKECQTGRSACTTCLNFLTFWHFAFLTTSKTCFRTNDKFVEPELKTKVARFEACPETTSLFDASTWKTDQVKEKNCCERYLER